MPYAEIWDPNTPQASESRALGDDRIRELKRAIQERLGTIMNFPDGNPLTLLPSVVADLKTTDGHDLDDASIPGSKLLDSAVGNSKVLDQSLGWYKLNNNALERIAFLITQILRAGQSTNHSGASIVVGAGAQASWVYPISTVFAPQTVGAAPAMGQGGSGTSGVFVSLNLNVSSTDFSPAGFAGFLLCQAYYDGASLTITVANTNGSTPITVNANCSFHLTFVGSFLDNVNQSTHTYGNPGSFTPL